MPKKYVTRAEMERIVTKSDREVVEVVVGILMDLVVDEMRDVVISNMDKYKEEGEEMDNF